MKVQIIHNPTAGKDSHSRQEIERFVNQGTFSKVHYANTEEEGWENFGKHHCDLIFLAGGDGTVHKLAEVLLKKKSVDSRTPIHILPLGTANNIAKTLDVVQPFKLHAFHAPKDLQKFDVGRVKGLADKDFFLEGVGGGIFPALISEMQETTEEVSSAAEKLHITVKKLLKIVKNFQARSATIKSAGVVLTGKFLLVEIMNIQYIGPNFELASGADPGDGYFDLVLIPEEKRAELIEYLEEMLQRKEKREDIGNFSFSMRVRDVEVEWEDSNIHVDDDLIPEFSGGTFNARIDPYRLRFVRNP